MDLNRKIGLAGNKWINLFRYLCAWIPVVITTFYVKYDIMNSIGFRVVESQLGKLDHDSLSLLDQLSFFRNDAVFTLILAPILIILAVCWIPKLWRAFLCITINASILFILYSQLRSFEYTGRFLSIATFYDAIIFGWNNAELVGSYVFNQGLVKFIFLLFSSIFLSLLAYYYDKNDSTKYPGNWIKITIPSILVIFVILLTPWISGIPTMTYHRGILQSAIISFFGYTEVDSSEFLKYNPQMLIEKYRKIARVPPHEKTSKYWGKGRGYDVIFIVFETAPARCLDILGDLSDFPNLKRLREHAFVGKNHYSTYPYTNRALFSLFSSWYPSSLYRNFTEGKKGTEIPAGIRVLLENGYETANYSQVLSRLEFDEEMYRSIGFKIQRVADAELGTDKAPDHTKNTITQRRLAADINTFDLFKKDLEKWLSKENRFAAAFLPQISHAPWPDLSRGGNLTTLVQRGRALLSLQDKWIGEIISMLEKHGRMDKTLIIVTGDHGIRTRHEDPSFSGGMIDDYSFHVPLLIYSPGVLRETTPIPWLTSHIDVFPTILDLLGIEGHREFEQGLAIWSRGLEKRVTFFFADHYLGADGFYDDGKFFMRNSMSDAVYSSNRMSFSAKDMLDENSPLKKEAILSLKQMVALQQAWGEKLIGRKK